MSAGNDCAIQSAPNRNSVEFATNARAIGGFVRWMTRDTDSQQTDRTAKVPLSGAQAAALLRIGGEPVRETERADGGTNGMIFGAAAPGTAALQAPASRAAGRITLAVLGLAGFSVLVQVNSEQVPPNAPQSSGLVGRAPDTGASHVHDTLQGHHKMLNKITGVTAAAVVGIAATVAGAQSGAVQWRAADGGNGHWYAAHLTWLEWDNARTFAESIGGHLATVSTAAENEFVADRTSLQYQDYWLGAKRTGSSCSPPCLEWITGEPWIFEVWVTGDSWGCYPANPNACGWNGPGTGTVLEINGRPDIDGYRKWNDESPDLYFSGPIIGNPSIIEWSADCNSDGIVDYGQCHDGTLPDYNGNNIPDCCERGEACVVGNYPVQWRAEDGGNGHWYVVDTTLRTWTAARDEANSRGAHLGVITAAVEQDFITKRVYRLTAFADTWLGASRSSCQGAFDWVTDEPFTGSPSGTIFGDDCNGWAGPSSGNFVEHIIRNGVVLGWETESDDANIGNCALYEWSADCNNDNIVDYGQIIQGQLTDSNTNGIPDICEQPRCQDADITNNQVIDGADLGALLAFWGPVNPVLPQADINRDGQVNGADIGLLLSHWGPCP